jgi:hypothetical protein
MKSATRAFDFLQTFRGGVFDPHHGAKGEKLSLDTPPDRTLFFKIPPRLHFQSPVFPELDFSIRLSFPSPRGFSQKFFFLVVRAVFEN